MSVCAKFPCGGDSSGAAGCPDPWCPMKPYAVPQPNTPTWTGVNAMKAEIAALKVERDRLREIIRDADDEMVAEVGDRHRASGLGKRMQDALEQSAPNRTDGQLTGKDRT